MHRITSLCVRHPWATVSVTLALTALAGWSSLRATQGVGTDASLGAGHPAVRQFSDFLGRFGGGYPIVIAFECDNTGPCRSVFDQAALHMAYAVARQLEQSSFVSRVSSPATSQLLVPSPDLGIDARRFVVDGVAVADPHLIRLALADPLWSRALVSEDGRVGAIVVELASTESQALTTVMADVRRAIEPHANRGFRFHLVGEAVMFVTAQEDGLASAARAGFGTGGMLFFTLLLLLRSLPAVVASLASIGVASAWTTGMLPLFGWQQSELTNGAATLILVIGCADCVHFAAHFLETRSQWSNTADALEATSRWVLAPCFLTSATTVGAFATFATGDVLALTQFGVMAAIGISLAFVLTFTVFPALMALLPARPRSLRHSASWQEVLSRLASLGIRRKHLVLSMSLALAILGASGIPRLQIEMNISELWGPDNPITRAIDFVSENLQRADRLEIEIHLPAGTELRDPAVLEEISELEDQLPAVEGLGVTRSVLSLLRHTNHLLRPGSSSLPDSEAAIAELLLLIS